MSPDPSPVPPLAAGPSTTPGRALPGRRLVSFAGGPGSVIDRGAGVLPPMVLLHGFGGDALSWQYNVHALMRGAGGPEPGRRVVAVDLPGHGGSTLDIPAGLGGIADWVERLLDALGLGPVDIVGHSMGGRVSLLLAARHPHRVRRLSLIACAGLGSMVDPAFLHALCDLETVEQAGALIDRLFAGQAPNRELLAKAFHARLADPAARAPLRHLLDRLIADIAQAPALFDWNAPLPPTQLIWGDADDIIPVPDLSLVPATIALHRLPGVGHMPHAQAASQVNALLTEFHR